MTKSTATVEVNQNMATAADNRPASSEISDSHTPRIARHTRVLREEFIRLMLSHQKLQRCDDHANGLRGLMDSTTGDSYFVGEEDLLSHKLLDKPA